MNFWIEIPPPPPSVGPPFNLTGSRAPVALAGSTESGASPHLVSATSTRAVKTGTKEGPDRGTVSVESDKKRGKKRARDEGDADQISSPDVIPSSTSEGRPVFACACRRRASTSKAPVTSCRCVRKTPAHIFAWSRSRPQGTIVGPSRLQPPPPFNVQRGPFYLPDSSPTPSSPPPPSKRARQQYPSPPTSSAGRKSTGGKKEEILGKDLLELEPSGGLEPDEDAWFNFYVSESNDCEGLLPPAGAKSSKPSTGETYRKWKQGLPKWQQTQLDRFTKVLLSKADRYQTTRNLSAVRKTFTALDIPTTQPAKILLNLWILALGLLGADEVVLSNLPPGGFAVPSSPSVGVATFNAWKDALARQYPDASFECTSIYGSGNATFGLRNIEGIYEAFPSASAAVLALPQGSSWSRLYDVLKKPSKTHDKIPGSGPLLAAVIASHIENVLPGRFLPRNSKSMETKGANKGLGLLGVTWDEFRGAMEGGWHAGGFPKDFVQFINAKIFDDIKGAAASEHLLCKPSRHDWASFKRMSFYRTCPRIFNMKAAVWRNRR